MAKEIERKYLVAEADWSQLATSKVQLKQGYLASDASTTVRVRVSADQAWLTIKGVTDQISRTEFEYSIPLDDALQMLNEMCGDQLIEKTRYIVPFGQHNWEVDVFEGQNQGLVVAEIELSSESELFEKPFWLKEEVSQDARYFNVNLMKRPFHFW